MTPKPLPFTFTAALLATLACAGQIQTGGSGATSTPSDAALIPTAIREAGDRITTEQIARDLAFLASDELRGRDTPSPGLDTAAAYIVRRLQAAGLRPLGDDGTYLQWYDIRTTQLDTLSAYIEIDGRRFRHPRDFLAIGYSRPAEIRDAPVVYVGRGHGADTLDVRGKVVLAQLPLVPSLSRRLSRRGAAAIVVFADPAVRERWEQRERYLDNRDIEPWVRSWYAEGSSMNVSLLQPHVADFLLERERVQSAELLQLTDSIAPRAPFELQRRITISWPPADSEVQRAYNVVAMLEGTDPVLKHEYVTIAAHLDGALEDELVMPTDSIFNAADDNASGSVAILAIAEQLARAPRPRRSMVFIWESGEEQGIMGLRRFVGSPPIALDRIVAHFNLDMVGATRAPGTADSAAADVVGPNEVYLSGPGVLSAALDSVLQRVNREYLNMHFNRLYDAADSSLFYPRTAAGPLLERRVIVVEFFTGLHERYHMPSDEAQYLDTGKIVSIARTVLASAWVLANSPERPRADKGWPERVPVF